MNFPGQISLIRFLVLLLAISGENLFASDYSFEKQNQSDRNIWKRISPEAWFSFDLPQKQFEILRAADAQAVTYSSDSLEVHYIFWRADEIPHFVRSAREQKSVSNADTGIKILLEKKVRVNNRTAFLTKTKKEKTQEKLPYSLTISFPRVTIIESNRKSPGEFELTVSYQLPVDEKNAWKIIRSLRVR